MAARGAARRTGIARLDRGKDRLMVAVDRMGIALVPHGIVALQVQSPRRHEPHAEELGEAQEIGLPVALAIAA